MFVICQVLFFSFVNNIITVRIIHVSELLNPLHFFAPPPDAHKKTGEGRRPSPVYAVICESRLSAKAGL
jgi:hypothetical protein